MISPAKRDAITILADILRVLAPTESANKMFIVYKANLNFNRIRKYLELLIITGHVEIIGSKHGNSSYRITDKGREFLAVYEKLLSSLRAIDTHRGSDARALITCAS